MERSVTFGIVNDQLTKWIGEISEQYVSDSQCTPTDDELKAFEFGKREGKRDAIEKLCHAFRDLIL